VSGLGAGDGNDGFRRGRVGAVALVKVKFVTIEVETLSIATVVAVAVIELVAMVCAQFPLAVSSAARAAIAIASPVALQVVARVISNKEPEITRGPIACVRAFVVCFDFFIAIPVIVLKLFAVKINARASIIAATISKPVHIAATKCPRAITFAVTPATSAVTSIIALKTFTRVIGPILAVASSFYPIVAVVPKTCVLFLT